MILQETSFTILEPIHELLLEKLLNSEEQLKIVGQIIGSLQFSLVDDASLELCGFCSPFDLEGIRSQKTVLIQQGILRQRLCDTYEGLKQNRPSTANCHRDPQGLSSKKMPSVSFIQPQQTTREQVIRTIKTGYLGWKVESFTCSDNLGLEIKLKLKAVPILNGELAHKNTNIEVKVNLSEFFMNLTQCCNDLKFFGRIGAVSCLFENLEVSGEASCSFN